MDEPEETILRLVIQFTSTTNISSERQKSNHYRHSLGRKCIKLGFYFKKYTGESSFTQNKKKKRIDVNFVIKIKYINIQYLCVQRIRP